jgi:hypothetical protein
MDYSLANELKNEGFPQGGRGRWTVDPNRIVVRSEDRAYVPTLEELIEACGDEFGGIRRWDRGTWQCTRFSELGAPIQNGKTPTEAVARLWLALNKK